jgi:hypothetical protein
MSIEEKIREIMLSEELPESEKLDRLHALISTDVLKIDNLNKATPAQLRRLKKRWQSAKRYNRSGAELLSKKTGRNQIAAARLLVSQYAK